MSTVGCEQQLEAGGSEPAVERIAHREEPVVFEPAGGDALEVLQNPQQVEPADLLEEPVDRRGFLGKLRASSRAR